MLSITVTVLWHGNHIISSFVYFAIFNTSWHSSQLLYFRSRSNLVACLCICSNLFMFHKIWTQHNRNNWEHFLLPNAPVHPAVSRYPGDSLLWNCIKGGMPVIWVLGGGGPRYKPNMYKYTLVACPPDTMNY